MAVSRRCSLVGTADVLRYFCIAGNSAPSLPVDPVESCNWGVGNWAHVLLTGFPAGMLACNCYVLAPHAGADAIVVDPGQRAMGPLRRILDENRLTPTAVLLTHGHIDHMWSAQKVADSFGVPYSSTPEDRYMLADPIHGFGPRIGQIAFGALFREPRQVVELNRDGDKLDLGGTTVTVDHTPDIPADRSSFASPETSPMIRMTSHSPVTPCSSDQWDAPTFPAAAGETCWGPSSASYWCSTTAPRFCPDTVHLPPSARNAATTHSSKVCE